MGGGDGEEQAAEAHGGEERPPVRLQSAVGFLHAPINPADWRARRSALLRVCKVSVACPLVGGIRAATRTKVPWEGSGDAMFLAYVLARA